MNDAGPCGDLLSTTGLQLGQKSERMDGLNCPNWTAAGDRRLGRDPRQQVPHARLVPLTAARREHPACRERRRDPA